MKTVSILDLNFVILTFRCSLRWIEELDDEWRTWQRQTDGNEDTFLDGSTEHQSDANATKQQQHRHQQRGQRSWYEHLHKNITHARMYQERDKIGDREHPTKVSSTWEILSKLVRNWNFHDTLCQDSRINPWSFTWHSKFVCARHGSLNKN